MSEQTDYTDEPLQIGERVRDFLPSPRQLVKREETVKLTDSLTYMPGSMHDISHNKKERSLITNAH
jgi:hypothetical protein